jgi:hypothetical protein
MDATKIPFIENINAAPAPAACLHRFDMIMATLVRK